MDARNAIVVFLLGLVSIAFGGSVDPREPGLSALLTGTSLLYGGDGGSQADSRQLETLVEDLVTLRYHGGPIMSGDSGIPVYIIWYGTFSEAQKAIIVDFFASFAAEYDETCPTVSSWWKTTASYRDSRGSPVMSDIHVGGQMSDDYSKGKVLSKADLKELVKSSLSTFPADSKAVYFVFTAHDVFLESFCFNTCGSHSHTAPSSETEWLQLPYAWVGNPGSQCANRCAWPFAKPEWGPQTAPLIAPNGDVGVEGMIINIATVLAGVATDPFNNAFFQGDATIPLEAASACGGKFGEGSYSGHAGMLLVDHCSGASYNAVGLNGRKYLLPSLWNPISRVCEFAFVPEIDELGFGGEGVGFQ